jgi:hypothetical protein
MDGQTHQFEARQGGKKQPLSQWMHETYSGTLGHFPMKVETLQAVCGSGPANETLPRLRQALSGG